MIQSGDRVLSRTPLSLNSNLVELGPWYFFLCRSHLLVSSQPCGTHVNCITTPPNSVYLLVSVVDSNSPPTDVMSELLAPRPAFLWGTCSIPSVWARRLIWLINFPREHLRGAPPRPSTSQLSFSSQQTDCSLCGTSYTSSYRLSEHASKAT